MVNWLPGFSKGSIFAIKFINRFTSREAGEGCGSLVCIVLFNYTVISWTKAPEKQGKARPTTPSVPETHTINEG